APAPLPGDGASAALDSGAKGVAFPHPGQVAGAAVSAEDASAALDSGAKGVAFAPPGQVAGAAASVFARDTQHFLDRGLAPQHLDAAVIADRGRAEARMAVELLLGDAVV